MNQSESKSYFFQSFGIVLLSAIIFVGIKEVLPKKIFSEKAGATKNVVVDSLMLEAVAAQEKEEKVDKLAPDTLSKEPIVFKETEGIQFPTEKFESYKGYQYLVNFYEKLYQLETQQKGNVRIAYFGDSMTDGDMIVQDLRNNYQEVYGGRGVGFVSITSESAGSRGTISHQFSPNWKTQSYLNVKRPIKPFGVNGHVFFTKDTLKSTWVQYKANNTRFATSLDNPTLFYGSSNNKRGSISVAIDKDTVKVIKKLLPNNLLNTVAITPNSIKGLKVNFVHTDSIPFYGFNFDDGRGVHIDNFSNRGNSGLPISTFNTNLMRAFNDKLGYDLIVLHYGTNVLNYGSYNYDWYDRSMSRVVEHLKECFPGVSILIISTADKASKYEMEMKTDSAVAPLSVAQKKYAIKTGSSFVNLYTLMGGDGSMVKWVDEQPAMANKDYTHFNFRGAKKVAGMIYNQLNEGYIEYKELRKKKQAAIIAVEKKNDTIHPKRDSTHVE